MRYYRYTLIDVASRTPVSIEPAKRGPTFPDGISFIFSIEQASLSGVPIFYGSAQDDWQAETWMDELSEETLIALFKEELKERSSLKRKLLTHSIIYLEDGSGFNNSERSRQGLAEIISAMSLDKTIKSVDFESSQWINLTLIQAKHLLKLINKQKQESFSWCCRVHKLADDALSIKDCLELSKAISEGILNV